VNSVVSLYYYARVVKVMFLDTPTAEDPVLTFRPVRDLGAIGILAVANLVLILDFQRLLNAARIASRLYPG